MKLIETLRLRSRLVVLFVFITLGLVFVGVMGTSYVNAMKKNTDSLYFGSLVPVTELSEILQTYQRDIEDTLYSAKEGHTGNFEASQRIKRALYTISQKWKSYASHYKREEELPYVEYADMEIQKTNAYFARMAKELKKEGVDGRKIAFWRVKREIENIHDVLQKLVRYEMDVAQYERKKFLQNYGTISTKIGFSLVVVILAVLLISWYVFESIRQDQMELERIAKKLKKANRQLENASYTDSLTGLYNRRYFNAVYERELKRAKRSKTYITFMMIDIDFFKQYNDTYGHIEGDFALKSVAKVLKDTLKRPTDYVFRLGGEEFGVLVSETNESDSATLARKICEAVKKRELKHEKSSVCEYVTVSVGVACCIADEALNGDVLISRADEMLYRAKEGGRDRYVITTNVSDTGVVSA